MNKNKKPKIGLALGSGGSKGLAHIGVIKVLEKNNIHIDYIAGSSIGALIGSYYAMYKDISKLEKVVLTSNWWTAASLLDFSMGNGFVKGDRIEKLMKDLFKEHDFNDLKIPLTVVATDLKSGEEVDISTGNFIKAVRASISVPLIFKAVKHGDFILADGGLSNPIPDDVVRNMGADIVISVNLDNKVFDNKLENNLSITKTGIRALNIIRYHFGQKCLKEADVVIEPKTKEIGLVGWDKFFNTNKSREIIKAGEDEAKKVVKQIKDLIKKYK